jgi:antitoxin (DNA-binding transcriptional repressor) of toxin-antitoxin stability system
MRMPENMEQLRTKLLSAAQSLRIDAGFVHDRLSLMRSATVADLRNNFAAVSKWIQAGEAVTITKRGRAFATLAPARKKKQPPAPIDRMDRLRRMFPGGPVKGDIQEVLDYERGEA